MVTEMAETMSASEVREIQRSRAEAAASRIAKSSPIERDELIQHAWIAVMDATPRFDPKHGAPLGGYLYRAAYFGCKRANEKALDSRKREPLAQQLMRPHQDEGGLYLEAEAEKYKRTILLRSAEMSIRIAISTEGEIDPDEVQWAQEVRHALVGVLADWELEDVLPHVLREETADEAAARRGVSKRRILKESRSVRARLAESELLKQLWKEQI